MKWEANLKRQLDLIKRNPQQQNSTAVTPPNPRDEEDGWILIGQKQQ